MLLTFDQVSLGGDQSHRLANATGEISDRGITALVGPSGAGKSTLLRLANRLEVPDSGTVQFRGHDINTLDPLVLRRRVAMVFQRPTPFPGSVMENLSVGDPELNETQAVTLLERVGLAADLLTRDALLLSGGEAQRVCLARALATNPEVVMMDEPTSSLEPAARTDLEKLARSLANSGIPIVWVTHDLAQMQRIADYVLVMIDGAIAHSANATDLEANSSLPVRDFLAGKKL